MKEIEIKSEQSLQGVARCICGLPAIKRIVIGEVQNVYGTEYDMCNEKNCEEMALENETYVLNEVRELIGQSIYENKLDK